MVSTWTCIRYINPSSSGPFFFFQVYCPSHSYRHATSGPRQHGARSRLNKGEQWFMWLEEWMPKTSLNSCARAVWPLEAESYNFRGYYFSESNSLIQVSKVPGTIISLYSFTCQYRQAHRAAIHEKHSYLGTTRRARETRTERGEGGEDKKGKRR